MERQHSSFESRQNHDLLPQYRCKVPRQQHHRSRLSRSRQEGISLSKLIRDLKEIKKIVMVGPALPFRGGIAQFNHALRDSLSERVESVELVTFSRQYPESLFPGKTQLVEDKNQEAISAPRVIDSINPVSWFKAAAEIVEMGADVVIFHYWMPFFAPAYGVILRRLRRKGIRSYAVVHNAIPHERKPGDARLSRFFLDHLKGIVTMARSVGDDLHSLDVFTPQINLAHPIYEQFNSDKSKKEARKHLSIELDRPVILFFGLVRKYKGLHALLNALVEIAKSRPDVLLVVAGEFYDDPSSYYSIIEEHNLQNNVLIRDEFIPEAEVGDYFVASDLVVQPYVTATQSGVAQIAFHFDKPVVVTNVGGLSEVVPDGKVGMVVPPANQTALQDAVLGLINDPARLSQMSKNVKEHKKQFAWSHFADKVLQMMKG